MCGSRDGGRGSYNYSYDSVSYPKPKEPKEISWQEYLRSLREEDPVNTAFFVELMRGCNNSKCAFQCDANKVKPTIAIQPEYVYDMVKLFSGLGRIVLYGFGDVSTYPFEDMLSGRYVSESIQVNVAVHLMSDHAINCLCEKLDRVVLNVYDLEDIKRVNALVRKREVVIQIQVVDIPKALSLFSHVYNKNLVLFRSSAKGDSRYVSDEIFSSSFEHEYGVSLKFEYLSHKIQSRKPVLESVVKMGTTKWHDVVPGSYEVVLRRCSRIDSQKIRLIFPSDESAYRLPLLDQKNAIGRFLGRNPLCETCTGSDLWKAFIEDNRVVDSDMDVPTTGSGGCQQPRDSEANVGYRRRLLDI